MRSVHDESLLAPHTLCCHVRVPLSVGDLAQVYLSCGVPMVEWALRGRDSLLFAYGQTGAGKTFSMYGAEGGKNPSKLDGVVPATVSELFRRTSMCL
jgi:hypothetical protein